MIESIYRKETIVSSSFNNAIYTNHVSTQTLNGLISELEVLEIVFEQNPHHDVNPVELRSLLVGLILFLHLLANHYDILAKTPSEFCI